MFVMITIVVLAVAAFGAGYALHDRIKAKIDAALNKATDQVKSL